MVVTMMKKLMSNNNRQAAMSNLGRSSFLDIISSGTSYSNQLHITTILDMLNLKLLVIIEFSIF